jgi:hypothetical protein
MSVSKKKMYFVCISIYLNYPHTYDVWVTENKQDPPLKKNIFFLFFPGRTCLGFMFWLVSCKHHLLVLTQEKKWAVTTAVFLHEVRTCSCRVGVYHENCTGHCVYGFFLDFQRPSCGGCAGLWGACVCQGWRERASARGERERKACEWVIYAYMYICIYIYIYVHIYMYIHIYIYTSI